ncbi:MAG TPA: hypothetical protein PLN48_17800, partial [Lachnospiraceae bacterium]|nr:hypothetical protein [Lachnospiraceae bacterium]
EGAYYKEGFTAKFDFSDADLDTKILTAGQKYYTWDQVQGTEVLSGKGKVSKANPSSANDATNATYTFAVNAKKDGGNDGGYLFYAFGTDKAGNALTVIEKNIDKKGTSNTREDCSGADKKLDKTKNEFYLKYLDTQQPTVAIDYNEAHSYYNENLKGWVAYYNTGIIATFRFADAGSLDENKLTYRQNKEGDDGTETHFNTAQGYNLINADETLTISAQTDHSNDGTYIYYIWGEDKAGNPLQVASEKKRNSNDSESSSDRDHSSNDSAYECGKKALDTVSPTVSINYTALDATHYYNNNAYYNKDFTTIFSYIDTYGTSGNTTYGIDQTKMFKGQAGPNSNDIVWSAVGSSTESSDSERKADLTSSYTVRADANIVSDEYWYGAYGEDKAGNPLIVTENQTQGPESSAGNQTAANKDGAYKSAYRKIMDTVSPAAALSISTDSANRDLQNGRYYFNKDFNATFNVVEANYDADKMHGLYSYNGNAVNYESDTVADPSNAMDYTSGNGSYSYSFNDSSEGLYRFSVSGEDRAGNACVMSDNKNIEITQSPFTSNIVAVDKTLPKVTVSVNDFYNAVLSDGSSYSVTVNRPYQKLTDATAVFQGDDKSPAAIQYNIPSTVSGQTAGADTPYVYNNRVTSGFNAEQIIYMSTLKITDRAGNVSNMNQPTNKIYLDVTAPTNDQLAPTISLTAHASSDWRGPSGNPLFKSTVTVNAQITDPGEGVRSSGLYHVYYKITVNGEDWTTRPGIASGAGGTYNSGVMSYGTSGSSYSPTASTADERLTSHDSIDFTFDADTFNYNDVKIYVWAEDNSGNKVEENSAITYSFGIDVTAPKIAVSYDNNSAQNEKYFKADRTATIVVTERNFDPSNTKINTQDAAAVSGWSYTRGSMANGDDDKWSCTVAYTKDGDYTFGITTADLLGHDGGTPDYGSSVAPTLFVLDKTNPTITISFDNNSVANGKYYNAHRTATVLVHEHNFSSEGARVTATAQILEGTVDTPVAGTWRTVGDDN